ncbi:MAG: hypothetical protein LBN39_01800 [Planctomycetaceae bacterium]|jgi:hypothetical protein|nr:hypothetical protein [Planctomycetaceae bacterium]
MSRRQLFRLIAYILLGVCFIFLLILYAMYMSAQKLPEFYQKKLAVSEQANERSNTEMRHKIEQLHNDLQKEDKQWETNITDNDLNGFFAVELAKEGANLFPKEIHSPRLSFSKQQIDFACRIEQGSIAGVLHIAVQLTVPEPNETVLQIKSAKVGTLPISKKLPAKMLTEMLTRKGYNVESNLDADEPVIRVKLNLKYAKKYKVQLDALSVQDGVLQLTGSSKKEEKKK